MSNWVTLSDLGYVHRGRSKHRPRNAPELYGGPYPFVQTADIKHAALYLTEYEQTYSQVGLEQSRLWPTGTLCITIAANIADTAILGCNACFPDSVIGFIPDKEKCDVRYIKYLFDTKLQEALQQLSQGVAQDNLSKDKLLSVMFPIPDLSTQCCIADILSAYDGLIENNCKRIALLEESAQELYKEWFVRLRFPGHEHTRLAGSWPKGWKRCHLSDVCNILYGKAHADIPDGDIPVIGSGGIMRKGNKALYSAPSVLIPRKGTLGNIMLMEEPFWVVDTMFYTQVKIPNAVRWLYFTVYAMKLEERATGTAIPSMTTAILNPMPLRLPSAEVLSHFEDWTNPIFAQIKTLRRESERLATARDALLPRLMKRGVA